MFFAIPTLVALDFVINLINAFLFTLLRQQHTPRFPGLGWCITGLWLHVAGVGLLLIGGAAPPLVSVALASGGRAGRLPLHPGGAGAFCRQAQPPGA
jgi:hypothetical protein